MYNDTSYSLFTSDIHHVLIHALFYITLYINFFVYRRSFYHLDPRWQILTFFNDLALEGMDNLEQSDGIISEGKVRRN